MNLGERIQLYRNDKKFSQEQLAEKAGVSTGFISSIERGIKSPSINSFAKIANALEVSSDLLLADTLINGYKVQAQNLTERIENLSPKERQRVFAILDAALAEY